MLTLVAALLAPRRGAAQEDAASISAARLLGVEGLKLADEGRCDEAIDRLERAERLHHAPPTLERLGECHILSGHLVLGSEMLQRVLREPMPNAAPPAFVAARTRAQTVLGATLPRIALLRVRTTPLDAAAHVRLDGDEVPAALIGVDRPTDPGPHEIVAHADGYRPRTTRFTLQEGERLDVDLDLERQSPPSTTTVAPPSTGRSDAGTSRVGSAQRPVGYALAGAGVIATGVGAVFGVLAANTKAKLDDVCIAGSCPEEESDRIARLRTQATISTAAFVAGGVAIAGGTILVLSARSRAPARPRASVQVAPAALYFRGTF